MGKTRKKEGGVPKCNDICYKGTYVYKGAERECLGKGNKQTKCLEWRDENVAETKKLQEIGERQSLGRTDEVLPKSSLELPPRAIAGRSLDDLYDDGMIYGGHRKRRTRKNKKKRRKRRKKKESKKEKKSRKHKSRKHKSRKH